MQGNSGCRFFLSVLLVCFVMSGAAHAAAVDDYIDSARELVAERSHKAAVIQLKNALQLDPGHAEARLLLGKVYIELQNGASAQKELSRAGKLGLPPEQWLAPLGEAYLLQGNYEAVLDKLAADKVSTPEARADVLIQRARALLAKGEAAEAREALAEADEQVPGHVGVMVGLAQFAIVDGNFDAALENAEKALSVDRGLFDAWLIKGEMLRQQGEFDSSIAAFEQALKLRDGSPRARLGKIGALMSLEQFDAAQKEVDLLLGEYPNLPQGNYLSGLLAYQRNDTEQAEAFLVEALRSDPSHLQSQLLLGAVYFANGRYESALENLIKPGNPARGNLAAGKLLASTYMKLEQPAEAAEVLEQFRAMGDPDPQLLALLGTAWIQAGEVSRGTAYLQQSVELAPDVAALHAQLALGRFASGDSGSAIDSLQAAVDLDQGLVQADVMLVLAHIKQKQTKEAIAVATAMVERAPDEVVANSLLGSALFADGDLAAARKQFERVLALNPETSGAHINLGMISIREDKLDEAEAHFRDILAYDATNVTAHMGLADIAARRGDEAGALKWIEAAHEKNPAAIQPGVALVRRYMVAGRTDRAVTVARRIQEANPQNTMAIRTLATALAANNEFDTAAIRFRELAVRLPDSAEVHHLLARAQSGAGDVEAAGVSIDRALELDPDYVPALEMKAAMMVQAKRPDEAAALVGRLRKLAPDNVNGLRLAGDVELLKSRPEDALVLYRRAYEQQPTAPVAVIIARVQWGQGDRSGATAVLNDWLAKHPEDASTRLALANYLQQDGRDAAALGAYEKVLEQLPDNVVALNNLAWLYNEQGDARAVPMAQRARERAPDNPSVADTVGWVLIHNGKVTEGLRLLQEAAVHAPHQSTIRYHLAVAYDKAGKRDEGRKELQRLLRDAPAFPEREEAERLLGEWSR